MSSSSVDCDPVCSGGDGGPDELICEPAISSFSSKGLDGVEGAY